MNLKISFILGNFTTDLETTELFWKKYRLNIVSKLCIQVNYYKLDRRTCGSPVKIETSPSVEPQAKTKPNSAGAN